MDKQLTPIQKVIEFIKLNSEDLGLTTSEHFIVIKKLEELLSEERQFAENAFNRGVNSGDIDNQTSYYKTDQDFLDFYKQYEDEKGI